MHIHIGHHFYGSGNVGDDFMLAGFLSELGEIKKHIRLTCCIPYNLDNIKNRFPDVEWQPYTHEARISCIKSCTLWLGLGGSPFQSSVSNWFIDHLSEEYSYCLKFDKPLAFIGIGSQDSSSFNDINLAQIIKASSFISTRDIKTYNYIISNGLNRNICHHGADLAHLYFSSQSFGNCKKGRLLATFNFDYSSWSNLNATLTELKKLQANEQIWLIQESRTLPGSEQVLYSSLDDTLKNDWQSTIADKPNLKLSEVITQWPIGEWTLTSRYHSALISFWGGSKTAILSINDKLESVAIEFGLKPLALDTSKEIIRETLENTQPISKNILFEHTERARIAVQELLKTFNI
jgi:polysaccharide pyruvyl transferase WcaK-like protein